MCCSNHVRHSHVILFKTSPTKKNLGYSNFNTPTFLTFQTYETSIKSNTERIKYLGTTLNILKLQKKKDQ